MTTPRQQLTDKGRPFGDLRTTGLLWLINTTVFHPRGYALALHYDDDLDHPTGWSLLGNGSEPWVFTTGGEGPSLDDLFHSVKALMP